MKKLVIITTLLQLSLHSAAAPPLPGNLFTNIGSSGFMENAGQLLNMDSKPAPNLLFKASSAGTDVYITTSGLSYVFIRSRTRKENHNSNNDSERHAWDYERLDMMLPGAHISAAQALLECPLNGSSNFYNGISHFRNVQSFGKITISDVYPGIDWVIYTEGERLKHDFIVHPGADASSIAIVYRSRRPTLLTANGDLVSGTLNGTFRELHPLSFQEGRPIQTDFIIEKPKRVNRMYETAVRFSVSEYDARKKLVIDPQITWATFYGSSGYEGTLGIDTDDFGNIFLIGYTSSLNFPTQNYGSYYQPTATSNSAFIMKFSNAGVRLWSTYFGSGNTSIRSVKTDKYNNVFITGNTNGANIPTHNTGTYFQPFAGDHDVFITKFDNVGNILWSTCFGGTGYEIATSITTANSGDVYVSGVTTSISFPLMNTGGFYQGTLPASQQAAFISRFDNNGSLLWSTFFEGIGFPVVATDPNNNLLLAGTSNTTIVTMNPGGGAYFQPMLAGLGDAVLAKFSTTNNQLWTTYYGGAQNESALSLLSDRNGNIFVSGYTYSSNFPTLNANTYHQSLSGANADIFLLKFNAAGVRQWATSFGGTGSEFNSVNALSLDTCGNIFVGMETNSRNMPLAAGCPGTYQKTYLDTTQANFTGDLFVAQFSNSGNYLYGTYLGGDGDDFLCSVATDSNNALFITGEWTSVISSSSYPLTSSASSYSASFSGGGDDIYIVKMSDPMSYSFSYAPVCSNDTVARPVTAQPSAGITFSAVTGLSLNLQTGAINPAMSTPGTYTIAALRVNCNCAAQQQTVVTATATISILPSPNLVIVLTPSACAGSMVNYSVSGANSYSWSNGPVTPTMSWIATTNTVFTVHGSDVNGCHSSATMSLNVMKCTGIPETGSNESGIRVFPNPNSGTFEIAADEPAELEVYDVSGRFVQKVTISRSGNLRAIVSGIAPGTYIVRASNVRSGVRIIVE